MNSQESSVYLISDIHSNLPALKAVLDEIPSGALIVCAGDILGYYLEPNEVCDLLKEKSVLCIQGNHDKYVLGELSYPASRESKYRILWTRQVLTAKNMDWLAALPDAILLEGCRASTGESISKILIMHGSPRDVEEYIYPDTPVDFLSECIPNILVLGHTHHPMLRQFDEHIIVNPGSVGQVRDRIPGACYARVDSVSSEVDFFRINYPVESYQVRLSLEGVDGSMIQILSRSLQ